MVGPELGDGAPEAPLPLGHVVRDVGHEVRERSIGLAHHAVLVVAVARRAQPERAVLFVRLAARYQLGHGLVDQAVGVERRFEEVAVEAHSEGRQVGILLAAQRGNREGADRRQVVAACIVAVGVGIVARDLANVFALVAVGGKRDIETLRFAQARLHRQREVGDLRAGVVVIELATHRVSLRLQQPRQRVADGGAATVTDVQRTGGIGRNEFDHDRGASTGPVVTELVGFGEHAQDDRAPRRARQENVDEPRAGDLGAIDPRRRLERCHQLRGELARVLPERARQLQRDACRIITVCSLLGALERDRGNVARCVRCSGHDSGKSCGEPFGDMGLDVAHDAQREKSRGL